jgi:hypothetical protein
MEKFETELKIEHYVKIKTNAKISYQIKKSHPWWKNSTQLKNAHGKVSTLGNKSYQGAFSLFSSVLSLHGNVLLKKVWSFLLCPQKKQKLLTKHITTFI